MSDETLPPFAAPRRVLETALYADDLDAARHFYGEVLGLKLFQDVPGRHLFFRLEGAILLVFNPQATGKPPLNATLPVPPHGASGAGHICFAMARGDIDLMRRRLEAADVTIDTAFDWPNGAHSLYVRDPAGNSIEFAEPWLWDGA